MNPDALEGEGAVHSARRRKTRRVHPFSWRFAALLVVSITVLAGCASHVTPEELLAQIDAGAAPTIVDVRSESEFTAGHVPGAIHLPFWSLAANLDRLPSEARDGEIVVYCEHGPRAGIARTQLWFADTGPISYLEGHMTTWRSRGLPMTAPDH